MVYLFYTTCVGVDLAHYEIFPAKISKGGINVDISWYLVGIFSKGSSCYTF